jgi:EAL domain-containing protein (putative c-di-GMP-specific phosphodiesterase class I)
VQAGAGHCGARHWITAAGRSRGSKRRGSRSTCRQSSCAAISSKTLENALRGGVSPAGIDLEITESLIMEDLAGNIAKLKAARELGVNIAIDDFGTGYSSLGYLAKLPVQSLKIDGSFITTMEQDPNAMTLVSTIISLAHSLHLKVTAEGVTTESQAKMLRLLHCDEMQGYLFGKPLPLAAVTEMLRQNG